MKLLCFRLLPLILFVMMALFLWRGLFLHPEELPSVRVGQHLPEFRLSILNNNEQQLTPTMMQGKVALINIWASWCASCKEEQAFLLKLQHAGIPIYGINYKDNPSNALQWLAQWGNPYEAIGEDSHGQLAIDLGIYGAPETFLIDKSGVIRYRYPGVLNAVVWQRDFMPLIRQLESQT